MAAEGHAPTAGEYIQHHLQHLQVQVGEGPFWVINLDSLLFKLLAIIVFFSIFLRVARRATPGAITRSSD